MHLRSRSESAETISSPVLRSIISESSRHAQLDAAALRVAAVFQFTPAMNRDERVPVWIQLPITFQVN